MIYSLFKVTLWDEHHSSTDILFCCKDMWIWLIYMTKWPCLVPPLHLVTLLLNPQAPNFPRIFTKQYLKYFKFWGILSITCVFFKKGKRQGILWTRGQIHTIEKAFIHWNPPKKLFKKTIKKTPKIRWLHNTRSDHGWYKFWNYVHRKI